MHEIFIFKEILTVLFQFRKKTMSFFIASKFLESSSLAKTYLLWIFCFVCSEWPMTRISFDVAVVPFIEL